VVGVLDHHRREPGGRSIVRKRVAALIAALLLAVPAVLGVAASPAAATSASTTLNLHGGDQLQANAWHCGTYFSACSWANSAKVLGCNPCYAHSVTNVSEVAVHGIVLGITISKPINISIIYKSSTLVRSRWTNFNAWISDSSGVANVSPLSTYVSSKETASASDPIFGTPSGVTAYAGAV
jgi:hypothetical protein